MLNYDNVKIWPSGDMVGDSPRKTRKNSYCVIHQSVWTRKINWQDICFTTLIKLATQWLKSNLRLPLTFLLWYIFSSGLWQFIVVRANFVGLWTFLNLTQRGGGSPPKSLKNFYCVINQFENLIKREKISHQNKFLPPLTTKWQLKN